MYFSWNVNVSEQECQVKLYNAVSGINIQYSSPLIDFSTVKNTSAKEEISFICQNHNQQSKLWTDKHLLFILIRTERAIWKFEGCKLCCFTSSSTSKHPSTWYLGVLLWLWLVSHCAKLFSAHLYLTSEYRQVPCMSQEISHTNKNNHFVSFQERSLLKPHNQKKKIKDSLHTPPKDSSQATECRKKNSPRAAKNKENEKARGFAWLI